jgi:hypothetical protein
MGPEHNTYHPFYRKIFWNVKESFIGLPFLKKAPQQFLFFPVIIGVPLAIVLLGQSSNTYYPCA